eukprot:XP_001692633.1 predicted protein [Chlamydomonas reinhardtii]
MRCSSAAQSCAALLLSLGRGSVRADALSAALRHVLCNSRLWARMYARPPGRGRGVTCDVGSVQLVASWCHISRSKQLRELAALVN